ncbi:MAG TPA: peptide ABC transporter substrate-binding protein [Pyrinomonadaceae bacterium]|nr:peptide ABC transporter substrate-binding protein [Pyrinomonadaceae bacterium]
MKKKSVSICVYLWIISFALLSAGCNELEAPKSEPFYAQTAPPEKKEFRWNNGKMPKTFDPAFAAAAPETDVVRALYEGLTDTEPKTLQAISAIAVDWNSSEDFKKWTFKLRRDAKWSNGKTVTAEDFVRSWKRLAELSEKLPHRSLLKNIVGMPPEKEAEKIKLPDATSEPLFNQVPLQNLSAQNQTNSNSAANTAKPDNQMLSNANVAANDATPKPKTETKPKVEYGFKAVNEFTLEVSLVEPDKDFPRLVAHPLFRPVFDNGKEFENEKLNANIVTSGAFRITSVGVDGITLDRSETYWNSKEIEVERVRFVPLDNAEKALEAYRAGNLDVITNASFEPLALKILQPFDDFRRTTHGAINFYEFNLKKAPFNDRRIREALAISIQRERLTEGEMEGATKPAFNFQPFHDKDLKLAQDVDKAQNLLEAAGFPDGENFPKISLVINRNEVQQRIARSVAKMWKDNLGIETEIVVKENSELETIRQTGEFDVLRRGIVLPTSDETANMIAIFAPHKRILTAENKTENNSQLHENDLKPNETKHPLNELTAENKNEEHTSGEILEPTDGNLILTEEKAIVEFPAIPLYFPTSYSLIKPYIEGFDINTLDAPSLKKVRINNNWQPKNKKGES